MSGPINGDIAYPTVRVKLRNRRVFIQRLTPENWYIQFQKLEGKKIVKTDLFLSGEAIRAISKAVPALDAAVASGELREENRNE